MRIISREQLRERMLLALCTDHGHMNLENTLACRTCNRRVDALLPLVDSYAASKVRQSRGVNVS